MKTTRTIGAALKLLIFLLAISTAAAATDSNIIFEDNFTDPQETAESWDLKDVRNCKIEDNMLTIGMPLIDSATKIRLKDSEDWNDFTFSCKMKVIETVPGKTGQLGVMLGGCYICIGSDEKRFLWASSGNVNSKQIDISRKGGWHSLQIVYKSDSVAIYFDDEEAVITRSVSAVEPICLKAWNLCGAFAEVRVMKNIDGKSVNSPNLLQNSSFEINTDVIMPNFWGNGQAGLTSDEWIGQREELNKKWKCDGESPYLGKKCMRVDGIPQLYSTQFSLKSAEKYTFSAYLRGENENMSVDMIYIDYLGATSAKHLVKQVTLTKDWRRYVFPVGKVEAGKGVCGFKRGDKTEGAFWVDAVQFERSDHETPFQPASADTLSSTITLPILKAEKIHKKPSVDGFLDDRAWSEAAKTTLILQDGTMPSQKTECFLAFDEENLYIGFKCYDSEISKVRESIAKRDGFVWLDDSVEIFLNPSNRENYYHMGVSVTGAQYDALKSDATWNGEWEAKTRKYDDRWECEIRVPFNTLDLSTFDRGDWKLNLARENPKSQEWSCWSPTFQSGFHSEKHFGVLKAFPNDITEKWEKETVTTVGRPSTKPYTLQISGKPFLGYGIYWASSIVRQPLDKNTFEAMRKANMNLLFCNIQVPEYTPMLNIKDALTKMLVMADEYKVGVVIGISYKERPRPENVQVVKTIINEFKDLKSVIGWCVLDEPHDNPDVILDIMNAAEESDPSRPAFITFTAQGLGMQLAGVPGGIICTDCYPVGFNGTNIKDVGVQAQLQTHIASQRKIPSWMILQTMSNWLWVERVVTPDELTAQTYDALVKGVTGIAYFLGFPLPQSTWERQIEIGAEIKQLEPILLSQELRDIPCSSQKIDYVCKVWEGNYYLVAVNPHYEAIDAEFDVSSLEVGEKYSVNDFFKNDKIGSKSRKIPVRLKPLERICYRIERVN